MIFSDYQLIGFAASSILIAIVFILQGQRLVELEVFGRVIIPLFFIYTALILYPANIPANWLHFFGAAILISTLVVILIDFVFVLIGSIKNSFKRMKNTFTYERTLGRRMPDYIVEICRAMDILASQGLGGLVIIERRDNLQGFVKGGVAFDAQVRAEILAALFEKKSSVHDGAILVRHGRIAKVKAVLPVDTDSTIPENTGLRHRSAVGITERTDAIAFITSEQRRELSIAYRGNIARAGSQKELLKLAGMALRRKNIYNKAQSKK